MKKIFIPVVGQFTNVGDVLHRRQLISWLRESGRLHIYVGNAPDSFIEGLKLEESDILYRKIFPWIFEILLSKFKEASFVFNPGEIRLENERLKREIMLFPLLIIIRIKKGKVLRIGIAAMSNSLSKNLRIWKLIFKTSNFIFWRTEESKIKFNTGCVIPDLAFYDFNESAIVNSNRKFLTISMRGDHPEPNNNWFEIIKEISTKYELAITIVSQVKSDNERTIFLSEKLNANHYVWSEASSHLEQEELVNSIYNNSMFIISDRLHSLILAFTRGSIPINLLTINKDKVQLHFDVIGLHNINHIIDEHTNINYILERFEYVYNNKEFYFERLKKAKKSLNELKSNVRIFLN